MSAEQRDKAAEVLREAKRVRDRLVREAEKPLDIEIVGSMGQMIDLLESARAATMPDREALIELLESSQHAPMETHDRGNGECLVCPVPLRVLGSAEIADAVLALLNKEGEE